MNIFDHIAKEEEQNIDLDSNVSEIEESVLDVEQESNQIENACEQLKEGVRLYNQGIWTLELYRDISAKGNVTSDNVKILRNSLEALSNHFNIKLSTSIAAENFKEKASLESMRVSLEAESEGFFKRVWKALVNAVKWIIDKVKYFFNKLNDKKIDEQIDETLKRYENSKFPKFSKEPIKHLRLLKILGYNGVATRDSISQHARDASVGYRETISLAYNIGNLLDSITFNFDSDGYVDEKTLGVIRTKLREYSNENKQDFSKSLTFPLDSGNLCTVTLDEINYDSNKESCSIPKITYDYDSKQDSITEGEPADYYFTKNFIRIYNHTKNDSKELNGYVKHFEQSAKKMEKDFNSLNKFDDDQIKMSPILNFYRKYIIFDAFQNVAKLMVKMERTRLKIAAAALKYIQLSTNLSKDEVFEIR